MKGYGNDYSNEEDKNTEIDPMKTLSQEVKLLLDSVKAKFKKNPYFKEEMSETHTYLLAVGLQLKPVKIRFLEDQIEVEVLKPLVFSPGQHFVVIKPDASGVRVCGKGEII